MKLKLTLLITGCFIAFISFSVSGQSDGDLKAINSVIDKYCETESAGDMVAQSALMSSDRVWIGGGGNGRVTDQKKNMEMQQMSWDEGKKFLPGVKWNFSARDRLIKTYGNGEAAVASFYWYSSFIIPGNAPMEKAAVFSPTQPSIITMVLEKSGSNWTIVHTHVSPMAE